MRRSLRRLIRRLGFTDVALGDPGLVERLGRRGVPVSGRMLDYVERGIPSENLDLGELTLLGCGAFMEANLSSAPSVKIASMGFWTLATLAGGDIYVFDIAEERVRMVDVCQLQALTVPDGPAITRERIETLVLDYGEDIDDFMESLADLYAG